MNSSGALSLSKQRFLTEYTFCCECQSEHPEDLSSRQQARIIYVAKHPVASINCYKNSSFRPPTTALQHPEHEASSLPRYQRPKRIPTGDLKGKVFIFLCLIVQKLILLKETCCCSCCFCRLFWPLCPPHPSQCTTVKEAQCFKKPYVFEEVRLLEVLQMDACGGLLLNLFSSNAFCHPARRPEASQH